MLVYERKEGEMADKKINTRVALLEQSLTHIQQSTDRIERRLEDTLKKIERIEGKIDGSFKWLVSQGMFVFFSAATLGFTVYQIFNKQG